MRLKGAVDGVNGSSYAAICGLRVSRSGWKTSLSDREPYAVSEGVVGARGSGAETSPLGVWIAAGRSPSSDTRIARSSRASGGIGSCSTGDAGRADATVLTTSSGTTARSVRLTASSYLVHPPGS